MSNVTCLAHFDRAHIKPTVIAIHCSGANRSEWRQLETDLGHRFTLNAPELIGSGSTAHWNGAHAFRLTDEAAPIVRMIDTVDEPVHLIGHSYGGAVALRVAIERPTRVASMILYEPAAFHVLKMSGVDSKLALGEISTVAGEVNRLVSSGESRAAARRFFEYWNGAGSWADMRSDARSSFISYIPKACLEFSAALGERVPMHAYRRFNIPTLLLRGEHAPAPTRIIVQHLAKAMRLASLQIVEGAGHMGPFTHARTVSVIMADWIRRMQPGIPADSLVQPAIDWVA